MNTSRRVKVLDPTTLKLIRFLGAIINRGKSFLYNIYEKL